MSVSFVILSTPQASGQGCPPGYRDGENARVFCTSDGTVGSCPQGIRAFPLGLALADFTGITFPTAKIDGWLDVAVVNSGDPAGDASVSLFRNTQDWPVLDPTKGLELAQDPIPLDTSPLRVAFGSLNDDVEIPAPDLVVMSDTKVYIFHYDTDLQAHYNPTPSLVLTPQFVTGEMIGMILADLDADGQDDIVVVGLDPAAEARAEVMWNRSPAFVQQDLVLPAPSPNGWQGGASDVIAVQIRQPPIQGRLDLAISYLADPIIDRFLNDGPNGQGGANWSHLRSAAEPAKALLAGSFRPGNLADIVISNAGEFNVDLCHMLWNEGAPQNFGYGLQPEVYSVLPGQDPFGVAAGLLNANDSYLDFVAACQHGGFYGHGVVAVFRGLGDGTFNPQPQHFLVSHPFTLPKPCFVEVGDMNNDGLADIVTSNWNSGTISVLIQIPDTDCEP